MHTQFSWDADHGDMEATCRRAVEIGLPAIAFTEHADFAYGGLRSYHPLDVSAYWREIERCRALFPGLRVLSGVELGEPHRFPAEAASVLASGPLDRVLGSVHCVPWQDGLRDVSVQGALAPERAADTVRSYFAELLALAESSQPFEVLAHLDYPKRYWPHAEVPYRDEDHEEAIRAVLLAAAARGCALEVNTTRGARPHLGLCPGPAVLGWWVEAGGRAVSLGSDAHDPDRIAAGFALAAGMIEAAGFRPNDDPAGCWLR